MGKKRINVLLNKIRYGRLTEYAEKTGKSLSDVIRDLIDELVIDINHEQSRIDKDDIWQWLNEGKTFEEICEITMTAPDEETALREYCKQIIRERIGVEREKTEKRYKREKRKEEHLLSLIL